MQNPTSPSPANDDTSNDDASNDDTSVEWCLGLPLVEQRPLTPIELTQLQELAKRIRGRGYLFGCSTPLVVVACIGIAIALGAAFPNSSAVQAVAAIFGILWFVPAAIFFLRARDSWKRSNGIRGDVRLAYAKTFAGTLSHEYFMAYQFPKLLQQTKAGNEAFADAAANAAASETATEHRMTIEVLPHSHRLWKVEGKPLPPWIEVSWSSVAKLPQFASMAAAWVEPIDISTAEPVVYDERSSQFGQRELSPSEKVEIQKRLRRIWLGPFWPSLFFTLWVGIPFLLHRADNTPFPWGINAYLVIAFAFFSYYHLWRALTVARQLKSDHDKGIVVILRLTSSEANKSEVNKSEVNKSEAGKSESGPLAETNPVHEVLKGRPVVVEVLPASGLQWSEGGRPAEWRKLPTG